MTTSWLKKKWFLTIIIVIIILILAVAVRFLIGGDEDTWLCQNNEWVKHGNPDSEKPSTGCGEENPNPDGADQMNQDDSITVSQPVSNQAVASPLLIKGQARGSWFFEASFPVKLTGSDGQIIAKGTAQAGSDWMTEDWVPFEATLEFNVPDNTLGILILQKDNPSGLPANDDELRLPVLLQTTASAVMPVKIYLATAKTGAEPDFDCQAVEPVTREITKTKETGRRALEQLLQGPTAEEKKAGYTTALNSGVVIQSLTIEQGLAKVDFNKQLEQGVGGSCRVATISAQITKTLLQFPTVNQVIISIDGRTEDILQP